MWVSLEGLLGEKNLKKIIPSDAIVISETGHPFGTSMEEYRTSDLGVDFCSLAKDKEGVKETLTIKKFIQKYPDMAAAFEWKIDNKGFLHLGGIYDLNGTIAYVIFHSLDLRGWIKKQSNETLTALCNQVTVWKRDGTMDRVPDLKFILGMEEIVERKFYSR